MIDETSKASTILQGIAATMIHTTGEAIVAMTTVLMIGAAATAVTGVMTADMMIVGRTIDATDGMTIARSIDIT